MGGEGKEQGKVRVGTLAGWRRRGEEGRSEVD